jgi:hypothetical protein
VPGGLLNLKRGPLALTSSPSSARFMPKREGATGASPTAGPFNRRRYLSRKVASQLAYHYYHIKSNLGLKPSDAVIMRTEALENRSYHKRRRNGDHVYQVCVVLGEKGAERMG